MGFNDIDIKVSGGSDIISTLQTYTTRILKPNIVDGKNVLTQEMLSSKNTKYVIKYVYELLGATLTMPQNVILEFDGGSIKNGTLVGNDTLMLNTNETESVLDNVTLGGTWKESSYDLVEEVVADKAPGDGMGRIILRKDKTFAEQFSQENTIYVIRYDFELTEDVTIPANCVLQFEGGSLSGNHTLTGNNTGIQAGDYQIFKKGLYRYRGYKENSTDITSKVAVRVVGDNVYLSGSWSNEIVSPAWVGLDKISSSEDAAPIITDFITLHSEGVKVVLPQKTYGIYGQIAVYNRTFDGNNSTFLHCSLSNIYDATIPIPEGTVALDSVEFPKGLPLMYQNIYIQGKGELCNFTIDQSNITTSDIKLNHWGIYGLVGKRGRQKSKIRNVMIKNAYECGFIGLDDSTEFINCIFDGSGEHELYGRPYSGEIIFRDCTFKNWENIQEIADARGAAFAMKIHPIPERVDDCVIKIIGCTFNKGASYSNYAISLNADEIQIKNSKTDIEWASFAGDSQENKVKHLYITGCEGIFYDYKSVNFITHIANSKGTSKVLQTAFEVSNCSLNVEYSESIDARNKAQEQILQFARKLIVNNTVFINNATTKKIGIIGAYEINITNCNVITYSAAILEDDFIFETKTNADDVEIEGVTPTLYICSSNFIFGKRKSAFIYATNYLVNFVDDMFIGGKYYPSGYLNNLRVVNNCKGLTINNTKVIQASDGTVLNLYGPLVTDVTFVLPTPASGNPVSNIGMQSFDYTNKKPVWWNGSAWVEATGTPV